MGGWIFNFQGSLLPSPAIADSDTPALSSYWSVKDIFGKKRWLVASDRSMSSRADEFHKLEDDRVKSSDRRHLLTVSVGGVWFAADSQLRANESSLNTSCSETLFSCHTFGCGHRRAYTWYMLGRASRLVSLSWFPVRYSLRRKRTLSFTSFLTVYIIADNWHNVNQIVTIINSVVLTISFYSQQHSIYQHIIVTKYWHLFLIP